MCRVCRWHVLVELVAGHAYHLRSGPYRIYFYSHEPNEPPHVHVDRDMQSAKFWLAPVAVARNLGFRPKELGTIHRLVVEHEDQFLEMWHEYFGE